MIIHPFEPLIEPLMSGPFLLDDSGRRLMTNASNRDRSLYENVVAEFPGLGLEIRNLATYGHGTVLKDHFSLWAFDVELGQFWKRFEELRDAEECNK